MNLFSEIESIDDHEIEDSIISQWTRHNPEQVGAWLAEEYTGSRVDEIKEHFIRNWSYMDRIKSADWMVNNSLPEKLDKNVTSFMQSWGYDNPEEAMQWFSQQSAEIYNQSNFSDFLRNAAYPHPQFAANHLSFIDDEKQRSGVAQSIYQGFKQKSSSKAKAFLEASPFRKDILKFDAMMNDS
ncbi:hypothetical protein EYS14_15130 [Alteromonadaceae bacterium M269]|nr:hypothetical protein EYS14_15130 [Alteromonadaceae bacterium M269]